MSYTIDSLVRVHSLETQVMSKYSVVSISSISLNIVLLNNIHMSERHDPS